MSAFILLSLADAVAENCELSSKFNNFSTPITLLSPAHRIEEVSVILGRLDFVEQKLHRLQIVHWVEQFAQHPDFLQHALLDEQFLAPCAGAIDVDGGIEPLLGHAA